MPEQVQKWAACTGRLFDTLEAAERDEKIYDLKSELDRRNPQEDWATYLVDNYDMVKKIKHPDAVPLGPKFQIGDIVTFDGSEYKVSGHHWDDRWLYNIDRLDGSGVACASEDNLSHSIPFGMMIATGLAMAMTLIGTMV